MRPFVNLPPRARGAVHAAGGRPHEARRRRSTAAQADLSAVADGLAREFPETNTGRGVALEPMHDALIGSDLQG